MIFIKQLSFGYSGAKPIFYGTNLHFGRGESWAVIGPSGCGKSTLLYLIAGLTKIQHGEIVIDGEPINRPRPETGLVLQDHGLLPWATVYDNVMMGHKIRAFYGPDGVHSPKSGRVDFSKTTEQVEYWLEWLGINGLRDMYPSQLSRGQRQRVAIARTLVLQPDLLLMDEPFSALDAPIREELQGVMNHFHLESGLTSLTVTHDIEEAVILGEKILVLSDREEIAPHIINGGLLKSEDVKDVKDGEGFVKSCKELRSLLSDVCRGELL